MTFGSERVCWSCGTWASSRVELERVDGGGERITVRLCGTCADGRGRTWRLRWRLADAPDAGAPVVDRADG